MNKTVTVNIGGIVFHIDENAYERFKQYLEAVRGHFSAADGRDEIMQDIESRIAEMFQERVGDSKQVITLTDVEEVTRQMGKPEDFGEGREEAAKETSPPVETAPLKRRLFRDPDDKLLGGVCSGIANYLSIDTVWVRLAFAFIFFVFGSGFLLYILLWIIIPEAKTTAEKLQMRGEPVTISNIEKNVKEEMEQLRNRASEMGKDGGKKAGTVVSRFFEAIGEIFKFFFLLVGKIIAVFFIFIGLVVGGALFVSLFSLVGLPVANYPEFINHIFPSGKYLAFGYIGAVLAIGIPFLMLAWAGARMLFNLKANRVVGFTALGLWLIGVIICLFIGGRVIRSYGVKDSYREEISIAQPKSSVIRIEQESYRNLEKDYDGDRSRDWGNREDVDISVREGHLISRNVRLDIVKSPTDSFQLVRIYSARGGSRKEAVDNASHIDYGFTQTDSSIRFQGFYKLAETEPFRFQKVQLVLRIPIGAKIYLDRGLEDFIYDIDNVQNIFDRDMLGRTWLMTADGLTCVDCTGDEDVVGGGKIKDEDFRGRIRIDGEDGAEVKIDENGVRIISPEGEKVIIDSSGVRINGRKMQTPAPPRPPKPGDSIRISPNGVRISLDGNKQENPSIQSRGISVV
ncbi:PspC domain-containing protein [Candidatus Pollutiaquabacter sp.]|uniref:PspC domain-containing protein n=1 Tax=Candidatus Pollutiaquabacter sp. TaxID=3416354 RepID=UPI003C7F00E8|nr:PspC domain-containing protein [Bacteroidota bacterium]